MIMRSLLALCVVGCGSSYDPHIDPAHLALDASVTVAYGSFTGCVKTRDFTAREPDTEEQKYSCPTVGTARSEATKGGAEHEDLVAVTHP